MQQSLIKPYKIYRQANRQSFAIPEFVSVASFSITSSQGRSNRDVTERKDKNKNHPAAITQQRHHQPLVSSHNTSTTTVFVPFMQVQLLFTINEEEETKKQPVRGWVSLAQKRKERKRNYTPLFAVGSIYRSFLYNTKEVFSICMFMSSVYV